MVPYVQRLKYAFRSFFSILDHSRVPDDVVTALVQVAPGRDTKATVVPEPPRADRATQMLALLQRDGRLLDFLLEDLGSYGDAQIGAAARDVHAGCRGVLTRYLSISPVVDEEEGQTLRVERGADPARIKVLGNVAGEPPFTGIVRHRGWQATRVDLPSIPSAVHAVLAPAEIEVQ